MSFMSRHFTQLEFLTVIYFYVIVTAQLPELQIVSELKSHI